MMAACIIPFPLWRRRSMVERQARRYGELNPSAAERHIELQLQLQEAAMRRKGIDERLIERELECFENAIRDLLARAVSGGAR